MKNKTIYFLVVVLFAGAYFLGHLLSQQNTPSNKSMLVYDECDLTETSCTALLNEYVIEIEFLQQPSSLKPFDIVVRAGDIVPEVVSLDFYMDNMDMGVNKYRLALGEKNTWSTQAMLPICSLARNDWVVELQIVHDKQLWFAEYRFEQKTR